MSRSRVKIIGLPTVALQKRRLQPVFIAPMLYV